jgi:hypothetical protein
MSRDTRTAAAPPSSPVPVRFADILFVDGVLDPNGQNPKRRRVVILTPNGAWAAGYPIVAAPVASQVPPVPTADHVLLPFKNPPGTRHPATGLTRRAAIVCTWLVVVNPQDITGRSRYMPGPHMRVVQAKSAAAAQALGRWP